MSSITGSAGTLGLSMQETTGSLSASLASGSIWSGSLKRAILQAGGTWPPAGTKTTSGPSATAATSRTKVNNGFLVDTSIASERERLKKLCAALRQSTETNPPQCEPPLSITGRKLTVLPQQKRSASNVRKAAAKDVERLQKKLKQALQKPIRDEVQAVRIERWAVMVEYAMIDRVDANEVQRYHDRIGRLNLKLWKLTGNEMYKQYMYKS